MTTFLLLGKYSLPGLKGATASRTAKITGMLAKSGGKVHAMYALLGEYDLAFIVEFPGIAEATQASFRVSKATGIAFATCPAMTVTEFDKLIS